jgi:hypothetical protein
MVYATNSKTHKNKNRIQISLTRKTGVSALLFKKATQVAEHQHFMPMDSTRIIILLQEKNEAPLLRYQRGAQ